MIALATFDLFPEVGPSLVEAAAAKRASRMSARHRHSAIDDKANNERYTTKKILQLCWDNAIGTPWPMRFSIDVAACPEAHHADVWHGNQFDGTFRDAIGSSWHPRDIDPECFDNGIGWCNPPYTGLFDFTQRAALAVKDRERERMLLLPPGDRAEQDWWQQFIEPFRDYRGLLMGCVRVRTWNLPGRLKFGSPGDPEGLAADSAPFPSVLVEFART